MSTHDHIFALIPKRPNVYTVDKPVLVSVTWAHTIFRFFDTFCEEASLRKKIAFFGPTDQKLKFWREVWAGWVCARAN